MKPASYGRGSLQPSQTETDNKHKRLHVNRNMLAL